DNNGSGIRHYEILVSTDGGEFVSAGIAESDTYAFKGEWDHTYGFCSRALDLAGWMENKTPTAEATVDMGEDPDDDDDTSGDDDDDDDDEGCCGC
ncbi:MAG: hypothetical protein GY849_17760, partial [Deltaproteobacteria bacterium]|nr:hypothetical protein [Deltaproteobacteria bacterium]